MITKQQALDFIYELSKKHEVCLDLKNGYFGVDPFSSSDESVDYNYLVQGSNELEELVKQFIIKYSSVADEVDKVPVDTDTLEIGKKYEVNFQEGWKTGYLKGVLTGFEDITFDGNDQDICVFGNIKVNKRGISSIYKINKETIKQLSKGILE